MTKTPYQLIQKKLTPLMPKELLTKLPKKWEKIGDILIIKLTDVLTPFSKDIGKTYASVLGCKAVLDDTAGITGRYRTPEFTHIWGQKNTETIHDENGIHFHLDPQHIMYSSGNMDERKRMATISNQSETVVDLFAGIGYFTIPMAVYSQPKTIVACEINETAYIFLQKNCKENKVDHIVKPLLGDCKDIAPTNLADRVIMGYFHNTASYLQTAIETLHNQQGIIHYHDTFPDKKIPSLPLKQVQDTCHNYHRIAHLLNYKKIKSYAPGISHYVCDIHIDNEAHK